METDLALDPTTLAGVGPARAAALARLGVTRVGELLFLVPRRLEVRGARCSVRTAAALPEGEVAVVGTLRGLRLFRAGRRRSVLALEVVDESGGLRALFFNQPWLFERLRALAAAGKRVELEGRVGRGKQGPVLLAPRLVEDPPEHSEPRLLPVYPTTEGLGQDFMRRLLVALVDAHAERIHDPIPADQLEALGLPPLGVALHALHKPSSGSAFREARRRLALERLLGLQARLARARENTAHASAVSVRLSSSERAALVAGLPFVPTAGQQRVLTEILDDLAQPRPMRRLLQGEVGSGKTLVALAACAAVARAGGQAALLVPTELLAEQHHLGLAPALERFGMRAVRLTGSMRAPARRAALSDLASGRAGLAIGTHALLSSAVSFARLDLCVIDEQQRFGVAQKQALLEKGAAAHALLMTATPIPRTLALCYYGDLETSLLRERPPGRGPLTTQVLGADERAALEAALCERVARGERVFWVCPRILERADDEGPRRESDSGRESRAETASAERVHAHLASGELGRAGLALLHGRLAPERRLEALQRFRSGEVRVLVATSMVEVGVDVPEATVMVIEGAECFGLSQLHQLRGRVGRSSRAASCFLVASAAARERLAFLEQCADGFVVAEEDLRRRGMGDLTGLRQAGENLEGLDDSELELELVQAARRLVRADPARLEHYLGQARGPALV